MKKETQTTNSRVTQGYSPRAHSFDPKTLERKELTVKAKVDKRIYQRIQYPQDLRDGG